jgi:2-keto-3-deoxy-L-fuconate dehydrogenase
MPNPFSLDGKIALVTGATSGIGEATARLFTEAGASVILAGRDEARADALRHALPRSSALLVDLTRSEQVKAAFASLTHLDILVNNAGIGLVGAVSETLIEDFDRLMAVNVRGVFLATKYALPLLVASHGNIVNIGSVAGLVGVKRRFAYCATKGAVVAMTRQLALDYPTEIRVNCICPGTVDTPFVQGLLEKYHKHEEDEIRRQLSARQPNGRLGRPEEIAAMALYLASDCAGFVTGSILTIDGGWTAA